jgi:hypothetical protein
MNEDNLKSLNLILSNVEDGLLIKGILNYSSVSQPSDNRLIV